MNKEEKIKAVEDLKNDLMTIITNEIDHKKSKQKSYIETLYPE